MNRDKVLLSILDKNRKRNVISLTNVKKFINSFK